MLKFLVLLNNADVAITVAFTIMLLYKWENKFFKIEKKSCCWLLGSHPGDDLAPDSTPGNWL